MRRVTVEWILTTERIDIESIAECLDLHPFSVRSTFPRGSIAKPFWSTYIVSDSNNIEEPLAELAEKIRPKMKVINEILQSGHVVSSIVIKVRSDCYAERPEMVIPSCMFTFFESINAELIFDVTYEE